MVIWLRSADDPASRIGVDGDILRREVFGHAVELDEAYGQLEQDRQQVLQLAEEQATLIVEEAEQEARRMRDEARRMYEGAEARGFAAGQQAALDDWHRRNLDAMTDARAVQARMRERLAELITAAVEQIVLAEQPQALFERALKTLDKISEGATYLRISVSVADYDTAVRTFTQLAQAAPRRLAIEVTPDKRLAVGSCVCESDYGVIDASLDTQLQAIRSAVERALKHSLVAGLVEGSQPPAQTCAMPHDVAAPMALDDDDGHARDGKDSEEERDLDDDDDGDFDAQGREIGEQGEFDEEDQHGEYDEIDDYDYDDYDEVERGYDDDSKHDDKLNEVHE
ncbi:type III secretion system stator protein SctL [Paraburkholderia youngii]|uniref:type III secretion system stator protein SctL n=1 Tax=Paraburkholderia youngii TaxID=2782701 RepID=UPI003D1920E1